MVFLVGWPLITHSSAESFTHATGNCRFSLNFAVRTPWNFPEPVALWGLGSRRGGRSSAVGRRSARQGCDILVGMGRRGERGARRRFRRRDRLGKRLGGRSRRGDVGGQSLGDGAVTRLTQRPFPAWR